MKFSFALINSNGIKKKSLSYKECIETFTDEIRSK